MATHPFVRFPWWVGLSAGVAATVRGDHPGWYVLVAYGSVYVGAHFVYHARLDRGHAPPALPWEYNFSCWPAAGVFTFYTAWAAVFYLDLVDLPPLPVDLVRYVQASYGVYYFLCCLVSLANRRARENLPSPVGYPVWAGLLGTLWKDVGTGGRAAAAVGATAAVGTAAGLGFQNAAGAKKYEYKHRELDLKIEAFGLEKEKFKLEKQMYYDDCAERYTRVGYSFSRDNGRPLLFEVQPTWRSPGRPFYSSPADSPKSVGPVDSSGLSSSGEDFAVPAWLAELFFRAGPAGLFDFVVTAVVVLVGWFAWRRLVR
jgi:hypothetical protein